MVTRRTVSLAVARTGCTAGWPHPPRPSCAGEDVHIDRPRAQRRLGRPDSSRIRLRLTTSPRLRISRRRISNSAREVERSVPRRVVAGQVHFESAEPHLRRAVGAPASRRRRARILATSSRALNGLVT